MVFSPSALAGAMDADARSAIRLPGETIPSHRTTPTGRFPPVSDLRSTSPSGPAPRPAPHDDQTLEALYATVRSLAALQDVDEVLRTIVRNANDLVETDVTHLSLVDRETGQLFVRAVEGDVSPAFRSARISTDIGVAGRVIATGRPFAVTNYRAAREINHDPNFDAIMRYEGLAALVGVPLTVGDEVIGVLHGSQRRARPFHREEVALLSAFADHAAVALDNARLYDQKARALSELSGAYDTIEANVEALERAAVVHDAMTALVLAGGTAKEVASLLYDRIERDVAILDRDDHLVAGSEPQTPEWRSTREELLPHGRPDAILIDAIAQSAATGHGTTLVTAGGATCSVVAIVAGETYLGALVVSGNELHEVDVRTIERAAQIIGLLTLQREAVLQAEEQVRGELVAELLSSRLTTTAQQRDRAAAREIDLPALRSIIVVSCGQDQRAAAARVARRVAREAHGLAGEHLGTVVVLTPGDDQEREAQRLHRSLRGSVIGPLVCCAAPLDLVAAPAREAFILAQRSCRLLLALGNEDTSGCVSDLAFYAMDVHPARTDELEAFLETTIGPVLAYDRKGRSDLIGTLGAYFRNSGNLSRTASELHVHVNTLLRRIERISSLVGDDWREPDRALELQFALRLRDLSRAIDTPPA